MARAVGKSASVQARGAGSRCQDHIGYTAATRAKQNGAWRHLRLEPKGLLVRLARLHVDHGRVQALVSLTRDIVPFLTFLDNLYGLLLLLLRSIATETQLTLCSRSRAPHRANGTAGPHTPSQRRLSSLAPPLSASVPLRWAWYSARTGPLSSCSTRWLCEWPIPRREVGIICWGPFSRAGRSGPGGRCKESGARQGPEARP